MYPELLYVCSYSSMHSVSSHKAMEGNRLELPTDMNPDKLF
jgi:hypothetical protein